MKNQTAPVLIVYFSRSGNTRAIANLIQQEVGGTLFELQPATAYPPAYNTVVEQAKREIRAGFRPPLRSLPEALAAATIFVGTPNWWDTLAPPVATFLTAYDLAGKTIAPFCTHGGGGAGKIPQDLARLCPGATVLEHLALYGSGGAGARAEVSAWLRGLRAP
ncbi:MAG: flavodoxin [Anaerolineae bacterium]|jgi:flavodoxin|nr:flavodoxin [Anaerolineae bacterium]